MEQHSGQWRSLTYPEPLILCPWMIATWVGCSKLLALPGPGNTVVVVEAQTGTVVSHQP